MAAPQLTETLTSRLERWQGNLLDLTLRNPLINFRERVSTVELLCPEPAHLLARLDSAGRLPIVEWKEPAPPEPSATIGALARGQVYARLARPGQPGSIQGRLLDLYRKSRRDLQEGGANTLFLALDVLAWRQGENSSRELLAPLVLVPMELRRQSAQHNFELALFDDAPRLNPALLELLRKDFGVDLAAVADALSDDADSITAIKNIRHQVQQAVAHLPNFQVRPRALLDSLSFGKYLMWKDLVDRTDELRKNQVVQHILDHPTAPYPAYVDSPEPHQLDRDTDPSNVFTPLSADSSQLAAIVAAERGRDFVIIGPPGAGKSQTIANIIAHTLAQGKTVLFVSEKVAALAVVYRRLQEIGLDNFCLELHSNKAGKLEVLPQLGQAWDAASVISGDSEIREWPRRASHLKDLRNNLNQYVERLHSEHPNGLTLYRALGEAARAANLPSVSLSWPTPKQHNQDAIAEMQHAARRLSAAAGAVGRIADNPLAIVANADWSPAWEQHLVAAASELGQQAHNRAASAALADALNLPGSLSWSQLAVLQDLAETIRAIHTGLASAGPLLDADSVAAAVTGSNWTDNQTGGWTLEWAQSLRHTAQRLGDAGKALAAARETAAAQGLPVAAAPGEGLIAPAHTLGQLVQALITAKERRLEFVWHPDADRIIEAARAGSDLAAQHRATLSRLSVAYDRNLLVGFDHTPAQQTWNAADTARWPLSAWRRRQARQMLRKHGGAADRPDPTVDLPLLDELAGLRRQMAELAPYAELVPDYQGLDTDPVALRQQLADAVKLQSAVPAVVPGAAGLWDVALAMGRLASEMVRQLAIVNDAAGMAARYQTAFGQLKTAVSAFDQLAHSGLCDMTAAAADFRSVARNAASAIAAHHSGLQQWCGWLRARAAAAPLGLSPLTDAIAAGAVPAEAALPVFHVNYCRWWADAVISNDDLLRRFTRAEREAMISSFRDVDERMRQISSHYIRSEISRNIPNRNRYGRAAHRREYGELHRLLAQKRPRRSLRRIFRQIPNALTQLTPVLLMSPLSVAQYLPPDHPPFDLVIFDEASQIPPWDAVGAMARGRQVIVAGDPKQLPPTSFFHRTAGDDDEFADDDDITDLESILDELDAASLPRTDLKWHYRSTSESLIAFSNRRYYDGRLITFPAPAVDDRAVRLVPVDGEYQRGAARANPKEARAVVAEVVRRLADPEFCAAGRTIGVVTFNSQQQTLIEDLLDDERRRNPAIEPHFGDDALEPVFVKNLENVQGDERDVILFSITYGPDAAGRVSMNFGPLNRDGGARRLNVAITRARRELLVFASLRPEQMDVSRSQSEGVRDLKDFLEFAERGPVAFAEAVSGSSGDWESPFEEAVAQRLTARGWKVHPQVGAASYRIDLGIIHPDAPGRYLAGVECDGATYHSSATARDRDKLRQDVLERLGWSLLRVWSTDFRANPDGEIDRITAALNHLYRPAPE